MSLDHTPSTIKATDFGVWLDYCILGAEEAGRQTPIRRFVTERFYNRPLTARQERIRAECKRAIERRNKGASA